MQSTRSHDNIVVTSYTKSKKRYNTNNSHFQPYNPNKPLPFSNNVFSIKNTKKKQKNNCFNDTNTVVSMDQDEKTENDNNCLVRVNSVLTEKKYYLQAVEVRDNKFYDKFPDDSVVLKPKNKSKFFIVDMKFSGIVDGHSYFVFSDHKGKRLSANIKHPLVKKLGHFNTIGTCRNRGSKVLVNKFTLSSNILSLFFRYMIHNRSGGDKLKLTFLEKDKDKVRVKAFDIDLLI